MKKNLYLLLPLTTIISVLTVYGSKAKSYAVECTTMDSVEGFSTVLPVGSEWIDMDFAKMLQAKGYIADAYTVTPVDVADVTEVDVSRSKLASLRGIEYFVSLQILDCTGGNQLTQLDVSKNKQFIELWCCGNKLTRLDVSKNTQLEVLSCYDNPGENGVFNVKAWFNNSNVPSIHYKSSWDYDGRKVRLYYYM